MMKKAKLLGISLLVSSFISTANATAPGFYIGGVAGYSNTNNIAVNGFSPTSNKGIAGGVFLGGNINPYIAVEGGYMHYAPSTYGTFVAQPSNGTAGGASQGTPQIRTNGVNMMLKGMFPFNIFSVFAKVGAALIRQSPSGSLSLNGLGVSNKSNTLHPAAAFGVALDLSQNWQVDASVSRVFQASGVQNIDLVALSISYHFVDKYCGQFLC